jgi:hypothetical protein
MIRVLGFKQDFKPNGKTIDWVHFTSGDALKETGEPTHSTWMKVSDIQPPAVIENDDGGIKLAALRSQWNQISAHYDAWKSGHEIPESGTPLGAWPALNSAEAEALKSVGIKTVEDVATQSEDRLARPVLPNMRELQRQAKMFLEGRGKAELEDKLRQLEEQNAAMLEMLAEQKAENKRGPGRPKKEETEAA